MTSKAYDHGAHPESGGDDLPITGALDERRGTPTAPSICGVFEEQARRTPEAVAVDYDGRQLTYDTLNRRANQLAHRLSELGVERGSLVCISMMRSPELLVGLLGILKAGGAYVPLDPEYPAERLAFMFADSEAPVLLTQSQLKDRLPEHRGTTICLDTDGTEIAARSQENPQSGASALDLAYVIYTSGSTGRPKGTAVPHRAVNRLVLDTDYVQLEPTDRVAQVSNASFDAATFEIWGALLNGGCLVGIEREVSLSPVRFATELRERAISTLFLTTALFNQMAREAPGAFQPLRQVLFGGEACDPDCVRSVLHNDPPERLLHVYGPTENTTFTTWHLVREVPEGATTVPIGRPIAATTVYILDERMRPVPRGVQGELYTGGDGLARGYWKRPELTEEKFLSNPLSADPEERLYGTGDLCRWTENGAIEILGRRDHQVKIHGFRVELAEIETALNEHPDIEQAVVLVREDRPGDRRLVAYAVPGDGEASTAAELHEFLGKKLPAYMVPHLFVLLERFPLTPNGKIDRQGLPAPGSMCHSESPAFVAPNNPTERELAALYSDVLGVGAVSMTAHFLELGGHSLLATRLALRVQESMQVDLEIEQILDAPDVRALAKHIDTCRAGVSTKSAAPLIERQARDTALPTSFAQARAWLLQQRDPEMVAYNYQGAFRLQGPLVIEALRRSLTEIVRRHEIYRTTFPLIGDEPMQEIHAPWEVELPLTDFTHLPEGLGEPEALRAIRDVGRETFDLNRLPLVRWLLFRLSESEHVLAHIDHHLVHDGWSLNVLFGEMLALYSAYCRGQPSPLAELPIQFADFAAWQRQYLRGEVLASDLEYWKHQLAGAPPLLTLPSDRPRPATATYNGDVLRQCLSLDLCRSVRRFSRGEGATLFMTMQAVFAILMHRYSGQDEVCVGAGIANRRWPGTEQLIGMMLNNVVIRNDLSGNLTFREFLGRVCNVTREAYTHQDAPFDQVVEVVQPPRRRNHNPLFQVMFSFHDAPLPETEIAGLKATHEVMIHNGSAKFDLTIIGIPRQEQRVGQAGQHREDIELLWEFNTDLFDRSTVDRMLAHYERLLEAAVADPERRVGDLPLLSDSEREQLLIGRSGAGANPTRETTIPELFEEQVRLHPDAVALVCESEELTYGELNRRANRVSRRLADVGAGPEVLVGLCMERSNELVVGLLGILKAGGAYLPIDLAYPADRVAFILDDAQAPVLLTQRSLVPRIPTTSARVVCIEDLLEGSREEEDTENPVSAIHPDSLAYVIYTSGTTGRPKGSLITHRNVIRLFTATDRWFKFDESDVWTLFHSCAFDFSVWEIWGALLYGGRLVVVPFVTSRSPEAFYELLARERVTVLNQTPSAFRQLISAEEESGQTELSLRCVIFGGEALEMQSLRPWFERHGDQCPRLVNMYGITETTVHVTYRPLCHADLDRGSVIGEPIPDLRIHILDPGGEPVPIGVPGEMYVGGAGVCRGYLKRPELTSERFVRNPFDIESEELLYRTGDLARWLPDRDIEYLGRIDQQVKIRGFRIELEEIESVLREHAAVKEVVVLAREDEPGDTRLTAYLVTGDSQPGVSELRDHSKRKLPDYMVPGAFVFLPELPLTTNGKLNRNALPAPDASQDQAGAAYVAPRTRIEGVLSEIWAAVLGLDQIGVHDDFFDLGGHSLLATRVPSRLRAALGVDISIKSMFEYPTVAQMACCIERMTADSGWVGSQADVDAEGYDEEAI